MATREVGRFWAHGTSGDRYQVIETEELRNIRSHTDPTSRPTPGLRYYRTTDGRTVNSRSDGRYELFDTHEILTRE